MTRVFSLRTSAARTSAVLSVALLLSVGMFASCKAKPSEDDCREATNNVRRINGQDAVKIGADPIANIRSCQANSSIETVQCMIKAKTQEDLRKCEGKDSDKYYDEAAEQMKLPSEEGEEAAPKEAAPEEAAAPEGSAEEAAAPEEDKAQVEATNPGEAPSPEQAADEPEAKAADAPAAPPAAPAAEKAAPKPAATEPKAEAIDAP